MVSTGSTTESGSTTAGVSNTGYTPAMAKVMVSLPDDLLRQLDAEARERGTTRSGLLRSYVQEGMQRRTQERARRMKELRAEPATGRGNDVVELLDEARQERLERLGRLER